MFSFLNPKRTKIDQLDEEYQNHLSKHFEINYQMLVFLAFLVGLGEIGFNIFHYIRIHQQIAVWATSFFCIRMVWIFVAIMTNILWLHAIKTKKTKLAFNLEYLNCLIFTGLYLYIDQSLFAIMNTCPSCKQSHSFGI